MQWPFRRAMAGASMRVCTRSSVVRKQTFFKVARNTCIADGFVCLADQDINVKEFFHRLACQAVVFGSPMETVKCTARLHLVTAWQPSLLRGTPKRRLGPPGFEPGT